jgi:hypothetical protein
MLLPALLVLTVAAVFLVWSLARVLDQRGLWYGVAFFALLFIGINGYCGLSEGADIHKRGRGYTSELWQNSQVLSYLANVGDARTIYSNGADVIRFLVRKEGVAMIPGKKDPLTRRVNLDSEEQLRRMSRECREGRALVAYFNTGIMGRTYLPSVGELESRGNLPVLRTFDDGVVYGKASEN